MSVGTIYKLHCNITGEDYYGSTKWYPNRISAHKCSTEKQLFKRQCKSRQILDRGNYTFSVLEECPIEELKPRERYYFENFPCINQIIPYKTREEILQYKRDRSKSEIGKQRKALYRQEHRQELSVKERERYNANKDEINKRRYARYVCVCGFETCINHKSKHEKSKKHLDFVENGIKYVKPTRTYEEYRYDKINCGCGGKYTPNRKAEHFKTKRHQKFINQTSLI